MKSGEEASEDTGATEREEAAAADQDSPSKGDAAEESSSEDAADARAAEASGEDDSSGEDGTSDEDHASDEDGGGDASDEGADAADDDEADGEDRAAAAEDGAEEASAEGNSGQGEAAAADADDEQPEPLNLDVDGDGEVTVEEASAVLQAELWETQRELKEAQEELKILQGRFEVLQNQKIRLQADFDNYRKRQRTEVDRLSGEKVEKALLGVLPVFDSFTRACEQFEKDESVEAVTEGLGLIADQFVQFIEAQGIQQIEAAGKPFDPRLHEALCRVPVPEGGADDEVVDVFVQGFMVGDKVLRPAKVSVAKEDG